jgi:hypothetical protein
MNREGLLRGPPKAIRARARSGRRVHVRIAGAAPKRKPKERLKLETDPEVIALRRAAAIAEGRGVLARFTVDVPPPSAVGVLELRHHHCRWPLDVAGRGTLLCGAARIAGLPYCAEHAGHAYEARGWVRPMQAWS